jgi:hypothetical protein
MVREGTVLLGHRLQFDDYLPAGLWAARLAQNVKGYEKRMPIA